MKILQMMCFFFWTTDMVSSRKIILKLNFERGFCQKLDLVCALVDQMYKLLVQKIIICLICIIIIIKIIVC